MDAQSLKAFAARNIHAQVGDTVTFRKTVSETDVYMFAGITGDLSRNHVDEEFMKRSVYGRRIAHGALLVGFMSTASVLMQEQSLTRGIDVTPVSLGYDRLRFLAPVFFGDTVTVKYQVSTVDLEAFRTLADMEVSNQNGTLVAVGKHITKWVPNAPADTPLDRQTDR